WFRRSVGCRVFRRPLQRILERHAATIAVSRPVVDANARYFHADWDIIPNGVDTTFFRPNGGGRRPTDALTEHPRLLFLGRIEPRNGLGTLLDAMPRILAHYPKAVLTVAGDGPWRRYYTRRARELGASVRFAGQVFADRPAYYGSADLYLCPTRIASFGVTLLEAMACGTPMIVSDNVGDRLDESLTDPPEDPASRARVLVQQTGEHARDAQLREHGLQRRVVAGTGAGRIELTRDDRVGCEPAAPRRRTDPLCRHRVREPRRVSDQEHPLARERPGARADRNHEAVALHRLRRQTNHPQILLELA